MKFEVGDLVAFLENTNYPNDIALITFADIDSYKFFWLDYGRENKETIIQYYEEGDKLVSSIFRGEV